MKIALIIPCFLIGINSVLKAQNPSETKRVKLSFSAGYLENNNQWSIAGNLNGTNPNIYSELKWKNLRGPAFEVELEIPIWKNFLLKSYATRSITMKGSANDTDYEEDNRVNPTFYADLQSNRGHSQEYSLGLGHRFSFSTLQLFIYGGYSKNIRLLFLTDESNENLKSIYKPSWTGSFVELSLNKVLFPKLSFEGELVYRQVNYEATADWNLISAFQHPISFTHKAKGFGVHGKATLTFQRSGKISPFISTGFGYGKTGNGIDKLFLTDGSTARTRLNSASYNTFNATAGVTVAF